MCQGNIGQGFGTFTTSRQKAPAFKHGDEWRFLIWGWGTGEYPPT